MDANNPIIKGIDSESNGIKVVLSNGNLIYMTEGNIKKAKKIESMRAYIIIQSTLSVILSIFDNKYLLGLTIIGYITTIAGMYKFDIKLLRLSTAIMYINQMTYLISYPFDELDKQLLRIVVFTNNLFILLMNHAIIDYNYM